MVQQIDKLEGAFLHPNESFFKENGRSVKKIDQTSVFGGFVGLVSLCELGHYTKDLRYAVVECNHWNPHFGERHDSTAGR